MIKQSGLFKIPQKMYDRAAKVIKGAMVAHVASNVEAVLEIMKEEENKTPQDEAKIRDMESYLSWLNAQPKFPLRFSLRTELGDWAYDAVIQASKIKAAESAVMYNRRILKEAVDGAVAGQWGEYGPLIATDHQSYEVSVSQDPANNIVNIAVTQEGSQQQRFESVTKDEQAVTAAIDKDGVFTTALLDLADMSNSDHLAQIGWGVLDIKVSPMGERAHAGLWHSDSKQIELFFQQDLYTKQDFEMELKESYETLRHELQHALQDMVKDLTFQVVDIGKGPDRAPGAVPRTPTSEHDLHDIEYQPRLEDSIELFVRYLKGYLDQMLFARAVQIWTSARNEQLIPFKLPDADTITIGDRTLTGVQIRWLNRFVKEQPFFKTLHEKAPERWRTAFAKFYAETSARLFPDQQ